MIDPRSRIIDHRLKNVDRIIGVVSGKGGVGKSLIATVSALVLAGRGFEAGLFDLDFTGPSDHTIMGEVSLKFSEDKGVVPIKVNGVKFMSILAYSKNRPLPLRGAEVSDALLDMLAVTRWDSLDLLFLDMPPGIGDTFLDIARYLKRTEYLVITNSSLLSVETVKKLLSLLLETGLPILGVIENMKIGKVSRIKKIAEELGTNFLGEISFDPGLEERIGRPHELLRSAFGKELSAILENKIL
ncbi:MAG: P-loop NTPase [Candidatus Bathyarchaeota archaeon]|nr:P-loop NTPase [Candidatus Bathyarchaeota archaeon]